MKNKILSLIALSAVMLSACTKDYDANETETSYTTGSYQQAFSESLAEQEREAAEEAESERKAKSAAEETFTERETIIKGFEDDIVPETTPADENADGSYRIINVTDIIDGSAFLTGDILCDIDYDTYEAVFFDIKDGSEINRVRLPEDMWATTIFAGTDGVLVNIMGNTDVNDSCDNTAEVVKIYDDYTVEIVEDASPADMSFEACGHKLSKWNYDIYCTDTEPEIIVAGIPYVGDGYDPDFRNQYFEFELDDERFVYRSGGDESLPGFGIYDFGTGTATDVPDSKDLIPFGKKDNKIYSVKTAWDGFGSEIFVTDADTLETTALADFPEWNDGRTSIYFDMPQNGEYIIAEKAITKQERLRTRSIRTAVKLQMNTLFPQKQEFSIAI